MAVKKNSVKGDNLGETNVAMTSDNTYEIRFVDIEK
jgi:hypothetical protein